MVLKVLLVKKGEDIFFWFELFIKLLSLLISRHETIIFELEVGLLFFISILLLFKFFIGILD